LENLLYNFLIIAGFTQKECDFFKRNISRVINIKVCECLLEMTLCDYVFGLQAGHDKFSEIDISRAICVYHSHQQAHPAFRNR